MTTPLTRRAASTAGAVLATAFGTLADLRRSKPLHPQGSVVAGRLLRTGSSTRWGVPWLDERGEHDCLVRFSRSVGLPEALPDVLGLALRFRDEQGVHDLLLASTGDAPVLRHVFLPRRDPAAAHYGSSFPYATPRGPVLLGAVPLPAQDGTLRFALRAASVLGAWTPFGTLQVQPDPGDASDELVDLDAVCHPLPGLALLPALARLREPSYAAARERRHGSAGDDGVHRPA
ncbi:MAG: hypothetical protein ACXVGH_07825 [Mycobacteriales bacterium]